MSGDLLDSPYAEAERKRHPKRDVACIILQNQERKYLFIRTYKFLDVWGWLGGGREPEDTSLVATAIRELREESAILLAEDDLELLFRAPFDFGEGTIEFFLASMPVLAVPKFNHEIAEHRWLTIKEATILPMYPASRACLMHLEKREK